MASVCDRYMAGTAKGGGIKVSNEERLLLMSVIDEVLIEELNYDGLFTSEQRDLIAEQYLSTLDGNAPKVLRERLVSLGKRLYSEIEEGD